MTVTDFDKSIGHTIREAINSGVPAVMLIGLLDCHQDDLLIYNRKNSEESAKNKKDGKLSNRLPPAELGGN